ncbi:iron ABC transporter permease [Actinotalea sp. Marseille-Q4924]|uniref:ABC transporter permease n=1 Tax=Actinotalea sp. Marseille-Q4924 TaxID=2866571 RepID=UPI001CE438AE|nr:iron ABC transporter permease [Actinotalea sp. Marseille-Q4924]
MTAVRRLFTRTPLAFPVLALLVFLVLGPLGVLVFSSARLTEGTLPFEPESSWTTQNYAEVLSAGTGAIVWNTLVLTVGALVVAFGVSMVLAWLIERTTFPAKKAVFVMVLASLGIPGFISAIAWAFMFNPTNGVVNVFLRDLFNLAGPGPLNIYTMQGMILLEGLRLVPVTFLLLSAAFRAMDATYEDAGAASGASRPLVIRRITIPLLTPAILSAFVYQLAATLESFDIPALIGLRAGIPVLSTKIFVEIQPTGGLPNFGMASAYGLLLIAIVLVPLIFYQRIVARSERYATVSGNTYRARRVVAGWRTKLFGGLFLGLYLLLDLLLPVLILIWTSLQPFYVPPSAEALSRVSLSAYGRLLTDDFVQQALLNTILLGFLAGVATLTLAFTVSWIVVRSRSRLRSSLDFLAFFPHSIPAIVLGLGVALIYLNIRVPIYGTIWILVIALATRYVSLATRQMNTGIGQVQRVLEDAAAASGASPLQAVRRILVPLVTPSLVNAFLLVVLLSVKNLVFPLILSGRDSVVFSSLIWNLWDTGDTAGTAVLSLVMIVITVALAAGVRRVSPT